MPTILDNQAIDAAGSAEGLLDALSASITTGDTLIIGANNLYTAAGRQDTNESFAAITVLASHRKDLTDFQGDCTGTVAIMGGGPTYEMASKGTKGTWARTVCALSGGTSRLTLTDLTLTTFDMLSGVCTVGSNADVTTLYGRGGEIILVEGGTAVVTLDVGGTCLARVNRDITDGVIKDRARVVIDSSTFVAATLAMEGLNAVAEFHRSGTVTALGAAAGGAQGLADFSRLEIPMTVTTIYESDGLTVLLPKSYPDLVTFGTKNTANGHARYEYV